MSSFLGERAMPPNFLSSLVNIYAPISTTCMIFRTIVYEIIPQPVRNFIFSKLSNCRFLNFLFGFTFTIEQRWKFGYNENYRAAEVYLPTIIGPSTDSLMLGSNDTRDLTSEPRFSISVGAKVVDFFEGMRLEWTLHCDEQQTSSNSGRKYFLLRCKKKYRERVLEHYFPHVSQTALSILENRENLHIYTYNQECSKWESTVFNHPSTFDTLAMEPKLKKSLIEDLDYFLKRQSYYEMIGKVWKRGYLLYGPPGTGKSSLVAAIANYVRYNVYDLQFQSVRSDAELRNILTSTSNRSILAIEDIDCATTASHCRLHGSSVAEESDADQATTMDQGPTLSGLLNFMDGLWSTCGEGKIIIFTTNCKEKLDPALLRPGRMDFHIKMEYCTLEVMKMLAKSYLEDDSSNLISGIHDTISEMNIKVTPAEVAQHLMKDGTPESVLAKYYLYLRDKGYQSAEKPLIDEAATEIEELEEPLCEAEAASILYSIIQEEASGMQEQEKQESLCDTEAASILYSVIEEEAAGMQDQEESSCEAESASVCYSMTEEEAAGMKKNPEIVETSGRKDYEIVKASGMKRMLIKLRNKRNRMKGNVFH